MTEPAPTVSFDGDPFQLDLNTSRNLAEMGRDLQQAASQDGDGVLKRGDAGYDSVRDAVYFLNVATQNFNDRQTYGNSEAKAFLDGLEVVVTQIKNDALGGGASADRLAGVGEIAQMVGETMEAAYGAGTRDDANGVEDPVSAPGETVGLPEDASGMPDFDLPDAGGSAEGVDVLEEIEADLAALDGMDDAGAVATALDGILDRLIAHIDGGTLAGGGAADESPAPSATGGTAATDAASGAGAVWTQDGVSGTLELFDGAKVSLLDVAVSQLGEQNRAQIEGMSSRELRGSGDPFLAWAGEVEDAKFEFLVQGGNNGAASVDAGRQAVGDDVDGIMEALATAVFNAEGSSANAAGLQEILDKSPDELRASGDPILAALGQMKDLSEAIDSGGSAIASAPPAETVTRTEQVNYLADEIRGMVSVENGSIGLHEDGELRTVGQGTDDEFSAANGAVTVTLPTATTDAGIVLQDLFSGESGGDETVTVQALAADGTVLDEVTLTGSETGEVYVSLGGNGTEIASIAIRAADDGFSDFSISHVVTLEEVAAGAGTATDPGRIDSGSSYRIDAGDLTALIRALEAMNSATVSVARMGDDDRQGATDAMVDIAGALTSLYRDASAGDAVSGQDLSAFAEAVRALNGAGKAILGDSSASAETTALGAQINAFTVSAIEVISAALRAEVD
ncbi:MAG: hypothetical protein MUE98_01020 [Rhodobacteraceae bacterium]|jgi:hypothetical protein|nr:hypothetical protein [Paracoccaceae bacterium]